MRSRSIPFMVLLLLAVCACARPSPDAPKRTAIIVAVPAWYSPEEVTTLRRSASKWQGEPTRGEIIYKTLFGKREALLQKVMLSSKRGEFADAVLVRNEWLGRLSAEKLIQPLPSDVARIVREKTLPALLPAVSDGEQVWAVPFDADVLVLWRNAALWKKPFDAEPQKPARHALAFPAARSLVSATTFLAWYFCAGGELAAEGRIGLDPPAARAALEAMLVRMNGPAQRQAMAAMEQADVFSCLAAGECAAAVGGSWERGMLKKQSPRSAEIEAVPFSRVFPDSTDTPLRQTTLVGGWSFALLSGAHPETPAFLIRLLDAESQRDKLRQNTLLPAGREILSDPWFAEDPDGPTFRQSLENGRTPPFHADMLPMLEHLATMLSEVFLEKKTPEQAVADAAKEIAAGRTTAVSPSPAALPAVSLRVKRPNGSIESFPPEKLAQFETTRLGDLAVIAVGNLCRDCGPVHARVTAVDGFKRDFTPDSLSTVYLEPRNRRVIVARENGETFTIRDVAEIAFSSPGGEGLLTVACGGKSRIFTKKELAAAQELGAVRFSRLADPACRPDPSPKTVHLIAADGYRRDIPWETFAKGKLTLKGMQCVFDGSSSKDQVSDLTRIEY